MTGKPSRPLNVFYSYAHQDQELVNKLETQLAILQTEGWISGWHFRKILAGETFQDKIDEHLNAADIILLLISADFLASKACYQEELKVALRRRAEGNAEVIPIILRPCMWQVNPDLSTLNALPTDITPVISWPKIDEALADVAEGIRKRIESLF